MVRTLLAKLLDRDLAYVEFGCEFYLRLVRYDADGRPFVMLGGEPWLLEDRFRRREVIWIRRRHGKAGAKVLPFTRPAA